MRCVSAVLALVWALSAGAATTNVWQAAGAKSLRIGGAAVWSDHANVIVAGEGCTASDVLALARLMARAAFFRSGVKLEPEIRGLEVW